MKKSDVLTEEEKIKLSNEIADLYNKVISAFTYDKKKKEEPLNVSVVEERKEVNEKKYDESI